MTDNNISKENTLYEKKEVKPAAGRIRRKRRSALWPVALLMLIVGIIMGSVFSSLIIKEEKETTETALAAAPKEPAREITDEEISELREASHPESEEEVRLLNDEYQEDMIEHEALLEDAAALDDVQVIDFDTHEETSDDIDEESQENISVNDEDKSLIELLKESLMNGEGTLASLRKVFRDQIMVVSSGNFYFFPVSDDLAHHGYQNENLFRREDGGVDYRFEDGSYAKRGVDVSRYQGAIDWELVKEDGIDFAIIRAGARGYGTGKLVPEEGFMDNAVKASEAGLEIGVYFFSQAVNEQEAIEEADCVLEALEGNEIAFPIVYDLERVSGGRMDGLSKESMTNICLAFCNRVSEAGYLPMIYGNMETFMLMLDMERVEHIEKWLAYYNPEFYFPYNFRIWQYSESGRVKGINGKVDMNLCFY